MRIDNKRERKCDKDRYQDAIAKYYDNPKRCLYCNAVIEIKKNEFPADARQRSFCNRSHSAKYNNSKYPKRKLSSKRYCPRCREIKTAKANICHRCTRIDHFYRIHASPISEYIGSVRTQYKFNRIRSCAKNYLAFLNIEKKCQVCGYDIMVDTCHRKAIADFPEEALMGEVNAIENLLYLCPNHHAEFDLGLLDLSHLSLSLPSLVKLDIV